jgi:hypothetical protein
MKMKTYEVLTDNKLLYHLYGTSESNFSPIENKQ